MSTESQNDDMTAGHWAPKRAHNRLPRLPPQVDLETKAVLKSCVGARVAVAELKQAAKQMPNQAMLISTLPLLEAQASSEIENVITTTDQLFQHVDAESSADSPTKEALRYRRALLSGVQAIAERPLGTRTAEEICSLVKGSEMKVRRVPGTTLSTAGTVVYTPPEGEALLRDLLANWERFLHEQTSLDPLVRMAVGHYQFEAIHPFVDGNGRTGRILNSLFLIEADLLTLPILYLSRHIIATKAEYYRLLLDVTRESRWEPWLLYMLRGVEETAAWTTGKVGAIHKLAEHTAEYIRATRPKIYSHELVNVIFEQPYCRIANLGEAGIAKRQAASRYLKELVKLGVLREQQVGREKLFVHPKLMALVTRESNEFAPYE